MKTSSKRFAVLAAVTALTATACGDSDSSDEATATATGEATAAPATDPPATDAAAATTAPATDAPTTETPGTTAGGTGGEMELAAGDVVVTGSSTVEPISVRVSELAETESDGGLLATVEGPGTGDGFEIFCGGEADVTGASRAIREEEIQACTDGGVEYVELKIGIDGLTVATNPANTAVECLDAAALYALVGPEAEGFANWSEANTLAGEVGSAYATLPDAPLAISGPGPESGTYDSFVEFAIADLAEERGQEERTRADYLSSANDNLIVEGIEGSDTSLGWVGYAYYKAEGDRMKAISIVNDETGECVAPTDETVSDNSYPFSRDLFIYVNIANAQSNAAVKSFVDLYLSDGGIAMVTDAGYVAESSADLATARDAWAVAVGG